MHKRLALVLIAALAIVALAGCGGALTASDVSKLVDNDKFDEAATGLDKVLADAPDTLWALHQKGFVDLAQGDYQSALDMFSRETELDPEFPDAWAGLALAQIGLGRTAEARDALDKALALESTNALAADVIDALNAQGP